MAAQGSGGAYEISQRMTALVGWGATTDFREGWVWDQVRRRGRGEGGGEGGGGRVGGIGLVEEGGLVEVGGRGSASPERGRERHVCGGGGL